jgi:hypothetical protein
MIHPGFKGMPQTNIFISIKTALGPENVSSGKPALRSMSSGVSPASLSSVLQPILREKVRLRAILRFLQ